MDAEAVRTAGVRIVDYSTLAQPRRPCSYLPERLAGERRAQHRVDQVPQWFGRGRDGRDVKEAEHGAGNAKPRSMSQCAANDQNECRMTT
jgi:hypothetical protein